MTCSFMLSELKTAFLIGFQIYLPFLILDMVVASVLMSLGMMMLSSSLTSTLMGFIAAAAVIGLGLSSLLGAPMRYIMLNEASAADRTSAQGVITLFIFYLHAVAAATLFTTSWQEEGLKGGLVSVGFLALIFSAGWPMATRSARTM